MKTFIFYIAIFLLGALESDLANASVCGGVDDTALFSAAAAAGTVVNPLAGETCIVGNIITTPAPGFGIHCIYGSNTTIKLKDNTNDNMFFVSGQGGGYSFIGCKADGNLAHNTGSSTNNFIADNGGTTSYIDNVYFSNWEFDNWAGVGMNVPSSRDWLMVNTIWNVAGGGVYFSAPASRQSQRMRSINAKAFNSHLGDGASIDNACDDCQIETFVEHPPGDCGIVFDNTGHGNSHWTMTIRGVDCGNNGVSIHSAAYGTLNADITNTCTNDLCTPQTAGWGACVDISNNEANQIPIHDITVNGLVTGCAKAGVRFRNNQSGLIEHVRLNLNIGTVGSGYPNVKFEDANSRDIRLNGKLIFAHLYYSTGTGLIDGGPDNFNDGTLTRIAAGKYKITAYNWLTDDANKLKAFCTAFDTGAALKCDIIDFGTNYVTVGVTNTSNAFVDAARVYVEVY